MSEKDLTVEDVSRIAGALPGAVVAYRVETGLQRLYASPAAVLLATGERIDAALENEADALQLVFPADRPRVMEDIERGLASGEDFDSFYRIIPRGAVTWIHAKAHLVGLMRGRPVIICNLIDDSSESANVAELAELSENAIYVIDAETYEILYINQACERLFGEGNPAHGQTCYAYKHGGTEPCPWCPITDAKGGQAHLGSFHQEGTDTWHEYDYRRLTWFGRDAWAIYGHDITERRREQEHLADILAREDRLLGYIRTLNEPGTFGERVEAVLSELGRNTGADRAYLFRAEGDVYSIPYEWCREGVKPDKESFQGVEVLFTKRWLREFRESNRSVMVTNVEEIRDEMPDEYAVMRAWGVTRYAAAPVIFGNELIGFIGIDNPDRSMIEQAGDLMLSLGYYLSSMTMRERERRELEESQRKFEHAVDGAHLSLWEYDLHAHRITMLENAATLDERTTFDLPKVLENVPASLLPLVEEEDVPRLLDMYDQVAKGLDASCDVWYRARDGREPRCERVTYTVVRGDDGSPVMAYGTGRNVTADRKVEERYENEMRFLEENNDYDLISKAHANLTQNEIIDFQVQDGRFFCAKPGTSFDDTAKAFLALPYPAEYRARLEAVFDRERLVRQYQQGRMQESVVYPRQVEDMPPTWVNMVLHTHMMPATGDIECFMYAYDITIRRQNEIVMDLIAGVDVEYVGLIYSRKHEFEFLHRVDRLTWPAMGERVDFDEYCRYVREHFVTDDERPEFDAATDLGDAIRELRGHGKRVATYRCTENGKIYCMQLNYNWFDEESETILVARTDVTAAYERNQRQLHQIQEAKLAADQANEEKSSFLSSMSHDIRTPLNGIIGFTDLALRADDLEKARGYMQKVSYSADLLLGLVSDVLDLSRIESGKMVVEPEVASGREVFMSVVESLRPTADAKGVTLVVSPFADTTIYVDKLKHQKIWLNLVSNSIKYTPAGGTVTVGVERIDPPVDGHNRRLYVADTGIGMTEEFQQRMFEPFAQEGRVGAATTKGTGLGLAIVKRIVDLLGGTIRVKSAPGEGTRFDVELDIELAPNGAVASEHKALPQLSLEGRHVLLCEDNEMNAEIATMMLEEKGAEVTWEHDGQAGFERFRDSAPGTFDAILMDVQMPRLGGRGATGAIRGLGRPDASEIPIVALTADAFEDELAKNLDAGMDAGLTKPLNRDALYQVLGELLVKAQETRASRERDNAER